MDMAPLWERLKRLLSKQNSVDSSFVYNLLADAEAGKESALPFLYPLAFDADSCISADAVEAITRLTENYSSKDWRRLDVLMRRHGGYNPSGFPQVASDSLKSLLRFGSHFGVLLGLASMNGSGFVRQEAVRQLALLSEGELPFLLIRLNDWVDEVQQEAFTACAARTRPEYAARYIAALPLVLGLATAGRNDLGGFIAFVEGLLSRSECRPVLLEGLVSHDAVTRRASFRIALASADEDALILFQQALLSHDPAVRRNAVRLLRARPAGDDLQKTFLERLSRDPLAAIRVECLILCYEKYPERANAALREGLLDQHPSVRSVSQYYLRRYGAFDLAAYYRTAIEIQDVSRLASAISGLGETGQSNDAERIWDFLHHPVAVVRRAAVFAVGRLNGEADTFRLCQALNDDSTQVSRAAREALEPHLHLIADDALWTTFTDASSRHSRRNSLRLMYTLPNWRAIVFLLKAGLWLQDNRDEGLMSELTANIRYWLARNTGIPPTRKQFDLLHEYLPHTDVFLPIQVVIELRRVMQIFEKFVR